MNACLTLEYDGSAFHGWQEQPKARTVAGELRRAIETVTGERPKLIAAGRTDAGAHSLGQTVNFSLDREITPDRLRRSLNGVLPADVAVLSATAVDAGFHSRFSALRREYRYLVENREARLALLRGRAWHVRDRLKLRSMKAAARLLAGRRDFAAFGADPAGRNTVRRLDRVELRTLLSRADGRVLAFDLRADAFLYGMVRRIVGFLVDVGRGRLDAADTDAVLRGEIRPRLIAPAGGLYQLHVEYPREALAAG